MALKLIAAPETEPIGLQEAKLHLRIIADVTDDAAHPEDALIAALIQAARGSAEHETGRALITQTWEAVYDAFPVAELFLGLPAQTVSSVVYVDADGDEQTLASDAYALDNETAKAFILPGADTDWPSTMNTANAVRVRFVAGYGDASAVPAGIKAWMLLQIGAMYAHRESVGKEVAMLPFAARLLDPFRVY